MRVLRSPIFLRFIFVLLLLGGAFWWILGWIKSRDEGLVLPHDVKPELIISFDDLGNVPDTDNVRFSLNHLGQPFILFGKVLMGLQSVDVSVPSRFDLETTDSISGFAWMRDGALLIVIGDELHEMTTEGLKRVRRLPSRDMKVSPASSDEFYLYGGSGDAQQRNVYMCRRDGSILHLLEASSHVGAVVGDGKNTFVAIDDSIFIVAAGKPLALLASIGEPVRSIAIGPDNSLFYSTDDGVGICTGPGEGFFFLRGSGGLVAVNGDQLYLYLPNEGIVSYSPASRLVEMSRKAEEAHENEGK